MFKNILRGLSLLVIFSLAVLTVSVTADVDKTMTINQARQIIASGGDTALIPTSAWKQILTPEQYRILWKKGTERPFTGALLNNKQPGTYPFFIPTINLNPAPAGRVFGRFLIKTISCLKKTGRGACAVLRYCRSAVSIWGTCLTMYQTLPGCVTALIRKHWPLYQKQRR